MGLRSSPRPRPTAGRSDNAGARTRLREIEARVKAERLAINEGFFFDRQGRRMMVEEMARNERPRAASPMMRAGQVRTDIVLLGGGHAHVHVLKAFAMKPEPGVRLTLVTRDLETPYSGMLPGVIAGLYAEREAHIDLLRLSAVTGTRLIHAEAIGIDRGQKRVLLAGRPPIAYDLLSIDVGITPASGAHRGRGRARHRRQADRLVPGKFAALRARCRMPDGPRRIAVIGGGAGGVELILSVRSHLLADARAAGPERDCILLRTGHGRRDPCNA